MAASWHENREIVGLTHEWLVDNGYYDRLTELARRVGGLESPKHPSSSAKRPSDAAVLVRPAK